MYSFSIVPDFTDDCQVFSAYVLHEIGHVLGLEHSLRENIMGSIRRSLVGLQEGDIEGIQKIYGE